MVGKHEEKFSYYMGFRQENFEIEYVGKTVFVLQL